MSDVIRCPHCGKPVEIEQALAAGLREKLQAELSVAFQAERREIEAKGKATAAREVALLQDQLKGARAERDAAQDKELALRKQREALETEKKALDLTIARRLDEDRARLRAEEQKAAYEAYELKFKERDETNAGLRRTIGELQRKVDQGSMQTQGEAQETSLEELLKREFPGDRIEPVAKGVRGADVAQHVRGPGGAEAGVILWESKHTKAWVGEWLAKLKDDQRAMKADVAALVSQVLPPGAGPVSLLAGVWVASYAAAPGMAHVLRKGLIDLADQRRSQEGRTDKEALLYDYLTGGDFKRRWEGLFEPFAQMEKDLQREIDAFQRIWAARAKQIERAKKSLLGLHGDVQGLAGNVLPEISLPGLPAPDGDTL